MKKLAGTKKYVFKFCFLICLFSLPALFSVEKIEKKEIDEASKSLGYLIGKKIKNSPIKLDQDKILEGIKEALLQRPSLSEEEYLSALNKMEEKIYAATAEKNLAEADLFLKKNAKKKNVVSLKKNKLQYEILKNGTGDTVQNHSSPLICYEARLINGDVFLKKDEQVVVLDELIPGLKQVLVGMQEQEKRQIFIHPSLGFGKEAPPPNALLIFEVEVIRADKSKLAGSPPSKELAEEKKIR